MFKRIRQKRLFAAALAALIVMAVLPLGGALATVALDNPSVKFRSSNGGVEILYGIITEPSGGKNGTVMVGDNLYAAVAGVTESVVIPPEVTDSATGKIYDVVAIGQNAFYSITKLTSVVIPDSVTMICDNAFHGSTNLTSVYIPNSVTRIGLSVFENCAKLTGVILPDGLEYLGSHAFLGCAALTEIAIPDSVKDMRESVFYGCTGLKKITIGSDTPEIGEAAFCNCKALEEIVFLGSKPPVIGDNAFGYGGPNDDMIPATGKITVYASTQAKYEAIWTALQADDTSTYPNWVPLKGWTLVFRPDPDPEPEPDPEPDPEPSPAEQPPAEQTNAKIEEEITERDTPVVYGVQYANGAVSYKVFVQGANTRKYAGATVRVTFNGANTQDIALDENGEGSGSFPAQPGDAVFSATLFTSPMTRSNRMLKITGAGKVTEWYS